MGSATPPSTASTPTQASLSALHSHRVVGSLGAPDPRDPGHRAGRRLVQRCSRTAGIDARGWSWESGSAVGADWYDEQVTLHRRCLPGINPAPLGRPARANSRCEDNSASLLEHGGPATHFVRSVRPDRTHPESHWLFANAR